MATKKEIPFLRNLSEDAWDRLPLHYRFMKEVPVNAVALVACKALNTNHMGLRPSSKPVSKLGHSVKRKS